MVLDTATADRNGVHNEIHNFRSLTEALPSQVFQVVTEGNQREKGWQRTHFVFRPAHRGHILQVQKAQCPSLEA